MGGPIRVRSVLAPNLILFPILPYLGRETNTLRPRCYFLPVRSLFPEASFNRTTKDGSKLNDERSLPKAASQTLAWVHLISKASACFE